MPPGREIVIWIIAAIATLLLFALIGYLSGRWYELDPIF